MIDAADHLADALRDRYVLERVIGRGGMATVYLVHDVHHDRP
jgi:serine/threonine protein kinase